MCGGNRQITHRRQFSGGLTIQTTTGSPAQQTQIAATKDIHLSKGAPIHHHLATVLLRDLTMCTKTDAVTYLNQVALHREISITGSRTAAITTTYAMHYIAITGRLGAACESDIRRSEFDVCIVGGAAGQTKATCIQAHALRSRQIDVTGKTEQALDKQG
ncbi:hypothetical protein D3C81_1241240 [compost metagenome]